ncbi:MAG: AAA domain-containing protein [Candidatus Cloacimonetes bacterium]|jgi:DNA replication ATP-dependent helicase Dna2|nr:AAA domain-containing protein [Candidatus Cloacimonadota bacterium]MDY0172215.1 AAA domain-containing protein [Candidatus Cloacimonadaceae bacterium]
MELSLAQALTEQLLSILTSEDKDSSKLISQRQLLEQIYKGLLADAQQSFSGLFAQMQYYHDQNQTPQQIVGQINALRILANKVTHGDLSAASETSVMSGALSIYTLLRHLSEGFEHPVLQELLSAAIEFPQRDRAPKQSFSCLIKSWEQSKSAGKVSGLELQVVTEDGEGVNILLRDDLRNPQKAKYSSLMPSLWQYASLYCHQLSEVAGRAGFFIDNPHTLIVLEPDFLVDASAIAECMTDKESFPELYLLGRLFSEGANEKMLLGQMVNSMFDTLIHEPELDYLELFKSGLQSMSIPMVGIGVSSANSIFRNIQSTHLPVIQDFCSQISKHDLLLEPSFLCPAYGLQGRLDLLYHQKGKYSIVELKSGKPHPHDVWPSQMYQVVAYNLIIRNAYGDSNLGSSSILYSAGQDKALRNVANMPMREQNLLHCRNRIVGIMRLLSLDPKRFFDWLILQSGEAYNPFSSERLQRFKRMIKNMRDFEYIWYCEQVKRIAREIWQVKIGSGHSESSYGQNALWHKSRQEKAGKMIGDLKILSYDQCEIQLELTADPSSTDFREGDIILLYQQERRVDQQEIIRGVIARLGAKEITINIRGGIKRKLVSNVLWCLEHDVIESFLYQPLASLSTFLEADPELRDLYLGIREPVTNVAESASNEGEQVIKQMQAATELYIVQGPPGTGKTSGLIGQYIESFYKETDKKMLVLSFTNRAVDEICLCLRARKIPFIRSGNSQLIEAELLNNLMRDKRYGEMDALLRENRIFIATTQSATSWQRDLKRITKLDEMIIDEASQILEPSLLGLVSLAPKCILIGDQNQLPAICVQSPLDYTFADNPLSELEYDRIDQSLMERLFRVHKAKAWDQHTAMLTNHYRMHKEIAGLISHYYENKLKPVRPEQSAEPSQAVLPEYLSKRLLWIDCPPAEQDYYDPKQVSAVVRIVNDLQQAGAIECPDTDIGIVAPYRVMIHALRGEIEGISIDTVERYQGSERDIIILCYPLHSVSSLGSLQSLSSDGRVDRKLNVALSRAKSYLIILANSDICRQSPHFYKLYENILQNGRVIKLQELD